MAVAGQIKEQSLGFAALLAAQRLVDHREDGVIGFRRRDNAFTQV